MGKVAGFTFFWDVPILDTWDIVGMNHYRKGGKRHIFIAMCKDGKCIKAEGPSSEKVVVSLLKQAVQ